MAENTDVPFDTDNISSLKEDTEEQSKDFEENSIISFIMSKFNRAEDARRNDETRWLRAYRNYRGLYSSEVQFTESEKSRVFVKVTKTKTLAAYGQIIEVLFGSSKFPLSVDPTKLPEGVAESVHINLDPNAEKGISELKEAFEEVPNEPFVFSAIV